MAGLEPEDVSDRRKLIDSIAGGIGMSALIVGLVLWAITGRWEAAVIGAGILLVAAIVGAFVRPVRRKSGP